MEAYDAWQASDRRYLSETSTARLLPPEPAALTQHATEGINTPALTTA